MIEKDYNSLSINRQCKMLGLPHSTFYYAPVEGECYEDSYLKLLEQIYLKYPFYGYRRINNDLIRSNIPSSEKKARNAMKKLGIQAIYPKPNLSIANSGHKKYPYLLKNLNIEYPNQAWATDITYIKYNGSFMYLVGIIDIFSRKMLSWKLSNTMDVQFCIEALNEALCQYGIPKIFNSDQGSQFTSDEFTAVLKQEGIAISMDSKGRALDNVYIERVWRSLKYENIFINEYNSVIELRKGVNKYFSFYNTKRYHQSLEYNTPDEVYYKNNLLQSQS